MKSFEYRLDRKEIDLAIEVYLHRKFPNHIVERVKVAEVSSAGDDPYGMNPASIIIDATLRDKS